MIFKHINLPTEKTNNMALSSAYYSLLSVIILTIQLTGLRYYGVDRLGIPISFWGDVMHHLAVVKAIIDQGSWWHIDRLGAPFGLDMYLFPVGPVVEYASFWFLSLFSKEPGMVINSYWIGSIVFTGVSACWSLRRLGVSRLIAFGGGILYAFLPLVFYRNIQHLMLVFYSVPPATAMCVLLLRGEWKSVSGLNRLVFWGALVLLGLSYIYFAFFACLIFGFSLAVHLLEGLSRKDDIKIAALAILLITFTTTLQIAPAMIGWRADPVAKANINMKSLSEADTYGLKIRHLLTPRPDHPVPILSYIGTGVGKIGYPLENENKTAQLGLLMSMGFLFLIGIGLLRLVSQKQNSDMMTDLGPVAALNLWLVLFATIGGFGSIFNIIVSPDIRTYNRVSPFIGFLALYAFCWLLVHVQAKLKHRKGIRWFIAGSVLLFGIGIIDQAPFKFVAYLWKADRGVYENTRNFIGELEKTVPPGAMIYQLPYSPYPGTPKQFDMHAHQHLGSYIVSNSVRFSWPALSEKGMSFQRGIASIKDPVIIAENLSIVGFEGIILDRWGFKDRGDEFIRRLNMFGVETLLESKEGRFSYLSLEKVKQRVADSRTVSEIANIREKHLSPKFTTPTGPLPESGFKAKITFEDAPLKAGANETAYINIRVKNEGTSIWRASGYGANTISLSHGWVSAKDTPVRLNSRFRFPHDVNPGESANLSISVKTPSTSGNHTLEVDIVQENVAWFSEKGNSRGRWNLVVTDGSP